jgi:hypothetical protein
LEREADEMIDIHLINVALVGMGISAAIVVLIAAAVLTIAAISTRRAAARSAQPVAAGAGPIGVQTEESSRPGQARREPALR